MLSPSHQQQQHERKRVAFVADPADTTTPRLDPAALNSPARAPAAHSRSATPPPNDNDPAFALKQLQRELFVLQDQQREADDAADARAVAERKKKKRSDIVQRVLESNRLITVLKSAGAGGGTTTLSESEKPSTPPAILVDNDPTAAPSTTGGGSVASDGSPRVRGGASGGLISPTRASRKSKMDREERRKAFEQEMAAAVLGLNDHYKGVTEAMHVPCAFVSPGRGRGGLSPQPLEKTMSLFPPELSGGLQQQRSGDAWVPLHASGVSGGGAASGLISPTAKGGSSRFGQTTTSLTINSTYNSNSNNNNNNNSRRGSVVSATGSRAGGGAGGAGGVNPGVLRQAERLTLHLAELKLQNMVTVAHHQTQHQQQQQQQQQTTGTVHSSFTGGGGSTSILQFGSTAGSPMHGRTVGGVPATYSYNPSIASSPFNPSLTHSLGGVKGVAGGGGSPANQPRSAYGSALLQVAPGSVIGGAGGSHTTPLVSLKGGHSFNDVPFIEHILRPDNDPQIQKALKEYEEQEAAMAKRKMLLWSGNVAPDESIRNGFVLGKNAEENSNIYAALSRKRELQQQQQQLGPLRTNRNLDGSMVSNNNNNNNNGALMLMVAGGVNAEEDPQSAFQGRTAKEEAEDRRRLTRDIDRDRLLTELDRNRQRLKHLQWKLALYEQQEQAEIDTRQVEVAKVAIQDLMETILGGMGTKSSTSGGGSSGALLGVTGSPRGEDSSNRGADSMMGASNGTMEGDPAGGPELPEDEVEGEVGTGRDGSATKIQKTFRGRLGRKIAVAKAEEHQHVAGETAKEIIVARQREDPEAVHREEAMLKEAAAVKKTPAAVTGPPPVTAAAPVAVIDPNQPSHLWSISQLKDYASVLERRLKQLEMRNNHGHHHHHHHRHQGSGGGGGRGGDEEADDPEVVEAKLQVINELKRELITIRGIILYKLDHPGGPAPSGPAAAAVNPQMMLSGRSTASNAQMTASLQSMSPSPQRHGVGDSTTTLAVRGASMDASILSSSPQLVTMAEKVDALGAQRKLERKRTRSAISIQALTRGHLERCHLRRRGLLASEDVLTQERRYAIGRIISRWKQFVAKKILENRQNLYRRLSSRIHRGGNDGTGAGQKAGQGASAAPVAVVTIPIGTVAATCLQVWWRARSASKRYATVVRRKRDGSVNIRRTEAAVVIQLMLRRHWAQRKVVGAKEDKRRWMEEERRRSDELFALEFGSSSDAM